MGEIALAEDVISSGLLGKILIVMDEISDTLPY
jgi:hypothetical protein